MHLASIGVAVACLITSIAQGAVNKPLASQSQSASKFDPKAERVVREAADYLAGLKTFSVTVDVRVKVSAEGTDQQTNSVSSMAFERPRKFAVKPKEGVSASTVVCDGSKTYVYLPTKKEYTVKDAGDDPLRAADVRIGMANPFGIWMAFSVLSDRPYETLMEGVSGLKYLGTERVDDRECHHLRFLQDEGDVDAWICSGPRPLFAKISPDVTRIQGKPANIQVDLAVLFRDWSVGNSLPEDTFRFEPPAGATKVDSLTRRGG